MLPVLGYWDVRGYAEPIRYLLHFKNIDFEDKKYPAEDRSTWEKVKFSLDLDFPNLPYYIDGNIRLTQSNTILRYLAGKYGFDGKTEEEKLRVSLAEQQIYNYRASFARVIYDPNFEQLRPEFEARAPEQMKLVANFLGNRKFLSGNSVTYVDFMAYDTIDFYRYLVSNIHTEFPTLKEYQERIKNLPELQHYLKSSDYKRWPIFSTLATFGGKGAEPKQE